MQKVVNVLALASAAVSLAVVGTVGYVFVNKDALIDGVKKNIMESVTGGLGGGLPSGGGALTGPGLESTDTEAASGFGVPSL